MLPAFACWAGLAPPNPKAPAGLLAAGVGAGLPNILGAGLPPAPPKLNGLAVFMLWLLGGEAMPPAAAPPNEKGALPAVELLVALLAPPNAKPPGLAWFWVAATALANRLPPVAGAELVPKVKGLLGLDAAAGGAAAAAAGAPNPPKPDEGADAV